jgi:hypothetical protein
MALDGTVDNVIDNLDPWLLICGTNHVFMMAATGNKVVQAYRDHPLPSNSEGKKADQL